MKTPKTFEDGMARLEEILAQMQSEETSLSQSIKLYAEAAKLMEYCNHALEDAVLQLDEIDLRLKNEIPHSAAAEEDIL